MKAKDEAKNVEKFKAYPFCNNQIEYGNDRVFGQIYLDEISHWGYNEGGTIKISASLVNEVMVNMEYEALETHETPLFFYEFVGEATFNDDSELRKYEWIFKEPRFSRIRIMDIDDFNVNEYKEKTMFVGEISFSASPILTRKGIIIVEEVCEDDEEIFKKMRKTYNTWDKERRDQCITDIKEIQTELDSLFGNEVKCKSVRIYNVGQANCCFCDLDDKKVFFDIGVTRSSADIKSSLVSEAIEEISGLDVDAVVLSHWDLDHILGVCYNQKCLLNKIWVVPDFEKLYVHPRLSIKRVCNYLLKNGNSKLLMVNTEENNKELFVSKNNAVAIYMGTPKAANGINKMNNGGLIMRLQNSRNILLPGDCENSVMPFDDEFECDNVVVPHHGSFMSDPKVKGKNGKKNKAYICCGKTRGNVTLDPDIVNKYHAKGFGSVQKTENLRKECKFSIWL